MDKVLKPTGLQKMTSSSSPWRPKVKKLTVPPKKMRLSSHGQGLKNQRAYKRWQVHQAHDGVKLKSWRSHRNRWGNHHMDKVLKTNGPTKDDKIIKAHQTKSKKLPVSPNRRNHYLDSATKLTALEKMTNKAIPMESPNQLKSWRGSQTDENVYWLRKTLIRYKIYIYI